ncbi:hypothetical protein SLA2020_261090 [Shorea laevis]
MLSAVTKLPNMSMESILSMFSQPLGSPASEGNLSCRNLIGSPELVARLTTEANLAAFWGVVAMVTVTSLCAGNLALSIMRIIWPEAIKGMNTKWGS